MRGAVDVISFVLLPIPILQYGLKEQRIGSARKATLDVPYETEHDVIYEEP